MAAVVAPAAIVTLRVTGSDAPTPTRSRALAPAPATPGAALIVYDTVVGPDSAPLRLTTNVALSPSATASDDCDKRTRGVTTMAANLPL